MHVFSQNSNNKNPYKSGNASSELNPAMDTNKEQLLDKDSCE
jgi:hypothetical protein